MNPDVNIAAFKQKSGKHVRIVPYKFILSHMNITAISTTRNIW